MKSLIMIALASLLVACGQPTQFDCIGTKTETMYANGKQNGLTEKTANGFTLRTGVSSHWVEHVEFTSLNNDGAILISGVSNRDGKTMNSFSKNTFTFDRNTQEIKTSRISSFELKGFTYETHTDFTGKCAPSK